jgi:hypothetical protein
MHIGTIDISAADVIRSIIFGQSATIAVFAVTNLVLTIWLHRPRPARIVGLIFATLSYIAALGCVGVISLSRSGQPSTYLLWVALLVVSSGTLGVSLLLAHVVLHSVVGTKFVEKFFGPHPDAPKKKS